MHRMDKKGADWKIIFTIILCLAVLGMVLSGAVPAINDFFKTGKAMQSCGGMGFGNGRCIKPVETCSGLIIDGLGCLDDKPLCCIEDKNYVEVEPSSSDDADYADCAKHSVKLTEISFDPTPKLSETFYVICYTDESNVPCMNSVKITNDANPEKTGTCNLAPNQPTNTNRKLFECPLIKTVGSYTFTCSLSNKGTVGKTCCIEGQDEAAISKNKELSESIAFTE